MVEHRSRRLVLPGAAILPASPCSQRSRPWALPLPGAAANELATIAGAKVVDDDVFYFAEPVDPTDPGTPLTQAKHAELTRIFVNSQFGPAQLDTVKEVELCIPSREKL